MLLRRCKLDFCVKLDFLSNLDLNPVYQKNPVYPFSKNPVLQKSPVCTPSIAILEKLKILEHDKSHCLFSKYSQLVIIHLPCSRTLSRLVLYWLMTIWPLFDHIYLMKLSQAAYNIGPISVLRAKFLIFNHLEWLSVHSLLNWLKAATDLGQESSQWAH